MSLSSLSPLNATEKKRNVLYLLDTAGKKGAPNEAERAVVVFSEEMKTVRYINANKFWNLAELHKAGFRPDVNDSFDVLLCHML